MVPPWTLSGHFIAHDLEPVLNSLEQIALWREAAGSMKQRHSVHVDTGMNRLGLSQAQWAEAARLAPAPHRLISHLACADEPDHPMNARQLALLHKAASFWPDAPRSLAATGGAYLGTEYHVGRSPSRHRPLWRRSSAGRRASAPDGRHPRQRRSCRFAHVSRGETVGYGATWTADGERTLATIGLGYADGFLRAASNRGNAVVGGVKRPIVGRVSMDLIVMDVTGTNAQAGG